MPEQVIGVWLIEDGNNVPSYVRRCVDHLPSIVWTMSPFNAYRFPSKEIAQVFMDWNVGGGKVVYHEFEEATCQK